MSVSRRSLLTGAIALGVAQLLTGCQTAPDQRLLVKFLRDAVPPPMLGEFRRFLGRRVSLDFSPEPQLADLFEALVRWQHQETEISDNGWGWLPWGRSPQIPHLSLLGHSWLSRAIEAELIQPLNSQAWQNWDNLPDDPIPWRDLARQGDRLWGAPYRWGTTAIVYRKDKFARLGWTPQDWSDLWREEVRGRVALLDSPREVIGLTLKKLGYSYNHDSPQDVPELLAELQTLQQQLLFYSSTAFQQPLLRGDVWVAQGYSRDILAIPQYGQQLAAVVPKSGTALWADYWVRPAGATVQGLGDRWIDFCWQPRIAQQLSLLGFAASPQVLGTAQADLPEALRKDPVLLPEGDRLQRSEFIDLDLGDASLNQYRQIWQQLRRGE
ncbi:extracellular solute-binding protein [Sodalinema gerasimenkoae]|uniref:extracellular solute-binding protein n=1 Tax=Sodalinema gerasimenkoae TaxID=2862348 RepID=UPI001358E284|nr:extracellular solute-binding protein [Sodalinema gerasimenkoae]